MDCLFGFCYTFLYTENNTKVIINILLKNEIILCLLVFCLHILFAFLGNIINVYTEHLSYDGGYTVIQLEEVMNVSTVHPSSAFSS